MNVGGGHLARVETEQPEQGPLPRNRPLVGHRGALHGARSGFCKTELTD
jgi:hypothetical protein